jgi:hypothetical protein
VTSPSMREPVAAVAGKSLLLKGLNLLVSVISTVFRSETGSAP